MLHNLSLLLTIGLFSPQVTQQPATTVLDSIARLALARNTGAKRAEERERAADAGVRQARGLLAPSVGVEARYTRSDGAVDIGDLVNPAYATLNQLTGTNSFPTDVSVTLPLRQESKLRLITPIFNSAIFAAIDGAAALRDLRAAERDLVRRQLDADARLAWVNWARAARAVEIWDSTLDVLTENVRVAQRCVEAGIVTPDAVHRARASLADAQQQRAEAVRVREAARGAVNVLLDQPDDTPLSLPQEDLQWSADVSLAAALQSAAGREEHRMARAAADGARAQGRAAKSAFLPSLALAADYGIQGSRYRFDSRNDVATASVVFSWNVFNGGQDLARRQVAAAASREATLQATEIDRQITLHVRTSWDAVEVARSALFAAEARVNAARSAFTLVNRRFAEGLASHLEWSDARAQMTAAQLNQVLTRYQLVARGIELERAAALRLLPNH